MSDDKARIEEAASSENDWVRARILKRDPPSQGSLLKIAERARDMAANSLGDQHSAYAVSLQNLGLYYDAIENDTSKANELFAQARAILKQNDLPLAYGFYWLGIFHNQVSHDAKRAETALTEALAIRRRALCSDDLQLAETMTALASAKGVQAGIHAAIALMEEALRIQRTQLAPTDQAILDTENRLAVLRTLARTQAKDGS
jgi:tetratricopeptide (TPR) repeat protein